MTVSIKIAVFELIKLYFVQCCTMLVRSAKRRGAANPVKTWTGKGQKQRRQKLNAGAGNLQPHYDQKKIFGS